jgi:hypothetical protein
LFENRKTFFSFDDNSNNEENNTIILFFFYNILLYESKFRFSLSCFRINLSRISLIIIFCINLTLNWKLITKQMSRILHVKIRFESNSSSSQRKILISSHDYRTMIQNQIRRAFKEKFLYRRMIIKRWFLQTVFNEFRDSFDLTFWKQI